MRVNIFMQFEKMNVINASLNLVYPRKIKIKEKVLDSLADIEKRMEDFYLPPNFIEVPEEIDPEIPRVIFNAINGHNQMIFSQINAKIEANFDFRFQGKLEQCTQYLKERAELMMWILECIHVQDTLFQGLTLTAQFPQEVDDEVITRYLAEVFNNGLHASQNINDFNQKITFVINDEYYLNVAVGNYRNYNFTNRQDNHLTASLSEAKLLEKGIFISIDVNNRYMYNKTGDLNNTLRVSVKKLFEISNDFINTNAIQILKEGVYKI